MASCEEVGPGCGKVVGSLCSSLSGTPGSGAHWICFCGNSQSFVCVEHPWLCCETCFSRCYSHEEEEELFKGLK